ATARAQKKQSVAMDPNVRLFSLPQFYVQTIPLTFPRRICRFIRPSSEGLIGYHVPPYAIHRRAKATPRSEKILQTGLHFALLNTSISLKVIISPFAEIEPGAV